MDDTTRAHDKGGTPPIGAFVDTPEGRLHYVEKGEGEAPFVLLHGASGNLRDMVLSLVEPLARHARVLAFDRPGFGHSRRPSGKGWLLAEQRAMLRKGLHALGIGRYRLVGHSFSGALVLDWALAHPEEVTGLGVISGATMDWGGALSPHYRLLASPLLGRVTASVAPRLVSYGFLRRAIRAVFAPQEVPPRFIAEAGVDLALRPETFRLNAIALNALHAQIVENQPRYGEIACPVEVVHGTADRIVPASIHAEPLAKGLPHARLTLLDGVGHMPHHALPDQVAGAMLRLPG